MLIIDDGNGCDDVEMVIIIEFEDDLLVIFILIFGDCENQGQLIVNIVGGSLNYIVSWSGFQSGILVVGGLLLVILGLVLGNYIVSVVSVEGCMDGVVVMFIVLEGLLMVVVMLIVGFCGQEGYIFVNIGGGIVFWQVSWVGFELGILIMNSLNVQIFGLLFGGYIIMVVSGNCDGVISSILLVLVLDFEVIVIIFLVVCGVGGSINVNVMNVFGVIMISWMGL